MGSPFPWPISVITCLTKLFKPPNFNTGLIPTFLLSFVFQHLNQNWRDLHVNDLVVGHLIQHGISIYKAHRCHWVCNLVLPLPPDVHSHSCGGRDWLLFDTQTLKENTMNQYYNHLQDIIDQYCCDDEALPDILNDHWVRQVER